jgi:hypothetical protein
MPMLDRPDNTANIGRKPKAVPWGDEPLIPSTTAPLSAGKRPRPK